MCFKCGGKYHPTLHKCPEKSLRVLILGEGEGVNEEGEIVSLETQEVLEEEEEEIESECKVIGVLGSMGEYNTMKIGGKLENIDVVVLVDSGATHNFISAKLTSALGLTITPMAARKIKLGDGHEVLSQGVCKGREGTKEGSVFLTHSQKEDKKGWKKSGGCLNLNNLSLAKHVETLQ